MTDTSDQDGLLLSREEYPSLTFRLPCWSVEAHISEDGLTVQYVIAVEIGGDVSYVSCSSYVRLHGADVTLQQETRTFTALQTPEGLVLQKIWIDNTGCETIKAVSRPASTDPITEK